jgi:hypothetical protein
VLGVVTVPSGAGLVASSPSTNRTGISPGSPTRRPASAPEMLVDACVIAAAVTEEPD